MKGYERILIIVLVLVGFANAGPPTLVLKKPKPGIYKKTEVSFMGKAIDKEDGKLSDSLVWESDIDGFLGTGQKLKEVLSSGLHTITLSVKDSEGYVSKAFTKIRILGDESIKSGIELTYVPGFGKPKEVFGRVYGFSYKDYVIAGYIKVYGGWWTKPWWDRPVTKISKYGSFKLKISTARTDKYATEIAVFLVPKDYDPPLMAGGQLPDYLFENFPYATYKRTYLEQSFVQDALSGVCYGPYRDNESPDSGIHPTIEEISEDIAFVPKVAKAIRTYSSTKTIGNIPELCEQKNINVYPGAWIGKYPIENEKEISGLIEIGKQGYGNVKVLVVGNEALLRRDVSEDYIIALMQRVREETSLSVTTAETWEILLNSPDVAEECDLLLIHVHPYWHGISVEDAVDFVFEKVDLLEQAYPDKDIVVGEVGWPSDGDTLENAVPNSQNQALFFAEFLERAEEEKIKYFWFELFDENWKSEFEGRVGAHWGIYNSDGSIKPWLKNSLSLEARETISRPARVVEPVEVSAPLLVYSDAFAENGFQPSGWIGNIDAIELDIFYEDNPADGDSCVKFDYDSSVAGEKWAGIYWQYPLNNWGKFPGYNLSGAAQLTFWARGEQGSEIAEFYIGGIRGDKYSDSFGPISTGKILLTTEWQEYLIDLTGVNTEMLIGGFAIKVLESDNPSGATIYLDEIVYESESIEAEIEFTYVPPKYSYDNLEGKVSGVNPKDYGIAVYIKVGSGWWTKPYWNRSVTLIKEDSTWICDITTGGVDSRASAIKAFLIPKDYSPPKAYGGSLPDEVSENAIAEAYIER